MELSDGPFPHPETPEQEEEQLFFMLEALAAEAIEEYRQGKTISLREWAKQRGLDHEKISE